MSDVELAIYNLDNLANFLEGTVQRVRELLEEAIRRVGPANHIVTATFQTLNHGVLDDLLAIRDRLQAELEVEGAHGSGMGTQPHHVGQLGQLGSLFIVNYNVRGVNRNSKAGHQKVSREFF